MKKVILGAIMLCALVGVQAHAYGSESAGTSRNEWGAKKTATSRPVEDNRPYNVAKIQACVTAAMPSTTGSTTPTTITKEKGNTLVSCIKNAREAANNNAAAIEALLKKVEELRAEIAKLKASVR